MIRDDGEAIEMKTLLALLAIALLSVGVDACGGAAKGTGSTSTSSSSATTASPAKTAASTAPARALTKADVDKDNDIGAPFDDNNHEALTYGHAANATDTRAVSEMVKRYYAAALRGDGATACAMIVSSLAKAVVEDYGPGSPGPEYLRSGKTCPAIMALLFKYLHAQFSAEVPKLKVARVRLRVTPGFGTHGFAIMSFGTLPERELAVDREGNTWKAQALIDIELP
jgi:hypothetical protein